MPRPKTKTELLELSEANYQKLLALIQSLPDEKKSAEFAQGTLNRNVSDVLCHLHHWHLMLMDWHQIGLTGQKPDIPAKGYTWKTLPDLNRKIQAQYSSTELDQAMEMLQDSHQRMRELIESYSNDELFEKKRFNWTGSTSLGAYLISSTSSHYDWALKLIKKCTK